MTDDATVSIVIPTFNRAGMLPRAIDTALEQTHKCEVLVVDHGSTDATPQVAAGYGDAIRYVRRDGDDGPFIAWLDGILQATGTYIHLTYDDDWLAPTFVAACLERMDDTTGLVFTNAQIVFDDHEERMLDPGATELNAGASDGLVRYLLGTNLTISPGCALFRRRDALQALMTNPVTRRRPYHGAGPDLMMFLLPLLKYARFGFVPEPHAFFRAHAGSITIDALSDPVKGNALVTAYTEYKQFVLDAVAGR